MQLLRYKKISGKIRVVTGLHIGGSKEEIRIGETDNPIIRHPVSNLPYIPGSSLKGKIRTLLEWHLDKVHEKGDVHACEESDCPICRIFGTSSQQNEAGPGRALFRDCTLTAESEEELVKLQKEKGLMYIEEKTENVIDRLTGRTKKGGLRQMERVPSGTVFHFHLDYRVFDTGDKGKKDEEQFNVVLKGLKLLQSDALGGSGSRGYGKIEFADLKDESGAAIDLEEVDISVP